MLCPNNFFNIAFLKLCLGGKNHSQYLSTLLKKLQLFPNKMQLYMQYIAYIAHTAMKKCFFYQNALEVCTNILMVIKP